MPICDIQHCPVGCIGAPRESGRLPEAGTRRGMTTASIKQIMQKPLWGNGPLAVYFSESEYYTFPPHRADAGAARTSVAHPRIRSSRIQHQNSQKPRRHQQTDKDTACTEVILGSFFQCHMWPCPARSLVLPQPMWHLRPVEMTLLWAIQLCGVYVCIHVAVALS